MGSAKDRGEYCGDDGEDTGWKIGDGELPFPLPPALPGAQPLNNY